MDLEEIITLELKQVLILRKDLKMSKGKAAAQASHAAVSAAIKMMRQNPALFNKWWNGGQMKVVLAVESETQLEEIESRIRRSGVFVAKINDAGRTQLPPGTTTALGIGPHNQLEIEKITSTLKLY
ncbi:aminoacyl-tRNA hydrolase [Candidatus Heimdallarchaeota archaeon B3_Heim]|nr:MAG: aminoacyl-tRNA hydrolase [Candidatus Heimdallarchaeota archaeon B3_Heim]